ncbi:MAG: HU family DNA-binding protein [Candidatus Pelagibacter bacterium]|nr:HU family DNA-binding protein [Candidatus Pelagibacter bacterium]
MAVVKSNLLKQLADGYPNFLRKDLSKLLDIILNEMENALKKGERVELRDIFTLETRIQKARISRNPKTNEKIETPNKRVIHFKMSKEWFKKVNNNE